jgi:predicted transcriptional regulator
MKTKNKIERISFRPDPQIAARLARIAEVSRRTITSLLNECVEERLPAIERGLKTRKAA